jgi:head-to-tail connecting protein
MADTTRQRYLQRHQALQSERSSWLAHWRELSEYIMPRRSRFLATDTSRGGKKSHSIINGTATKAARILAAGMQSGITSPARPWFRLTTPDQALAKTYRVRVWLDEVMERMRTAMARSNIYNALHNVYLDLAVTGTSVMLLEPDEEDGMRAYTLPVGSYCLQNSERLAVDTLYREASFTNEQLEARFGLDALSLRVKEALQRGDRDSMVRVLHVIERNRDYEEGRLGHKGKKWRSCWMETDAGEEHRTHLSEAGYDRLPVIATRWDVTGEDVYGSSPGMDALGDVRALQSLEKSAGKAVAKIVDPPMVGPMSLANQHASLLPGHITLVDVVQGGQTFRPAMELNPMSVQVLEAKIREHERRISRDFYADLWLSMLSAEDTARTAREVSERHEEKMLQLGPVLERLQDELLDPVVGETFQILLAAGQLPPPPEELAGAPLRVEYVSIMAQAQRMLGTTAVERLLSVAGNVAAVSPTIVDKVDFDAALDAYADMLGTPAKLLRAQEDVDAMRQQREAQAQAQAAAQQALTVAQGAQTLSKADMGGDSALSRLVGAMGGVAAGSAAPQTQ